MVGYLDFTRYFENKIYPRVTIAGQDVGGQNKDQTKKIIENKMVNFTDQKIKLTHKVDEFSPNLSDLGVKVETQDMIEQAFLFGRNGTIEQKIKENFELLTKGYNVPITISINQGKTNEYIDIISPQIETEVIDRKIAEATGKILDEGNDGLTVNKTDLLEKIKTQIAKNNFSEPIIIPTTTIARGEQIIKTVFTPGNYYGKYIDVNLAEQKMILFDNNIAMQEYTVSTGKWSTPTPVGTRYIQNKNPKAWSAKYGLYMPYWNGLGDGYGIHELPEWPSGYKEGEAHLGTPVSHGCIRLGVGSAEYVYNWAPVGTPVYIHK